jgi:hypothetical protein
MHGVLPLSGSPAYRTPNTSTRTEHSKEARMGKRCQWPGCRAWAMRGTTHCWSHRADTAALDASGAYHALPDERRARAEAFSALVTHGAGGDLVERAVGAMLAAMAVGGERVPLEGEIRALRLILSRVIALDALEGEPREVAQTVTRLVDTIVRAVRAQHGLVGDGADGELAALAALVSSVMDEIGMGGH